MDTKTTILAVLVAIAVIGQLTLPIWGGWYRKREERLAKQKIARLLEDAADQQIAAAKPQSDTLAKLDSKGVGND